MTTVTFLTEESRIIGFEVSGHSGYADAGEDIICAAITSAVRLVEATVNDVLVSRGNRNLIVEALDATHRRMPAFASDRVTSLGDIAMYTDAEDIPLWQVLKNLGEKEQSKECSLNYKKCSADELHNFFAEVLPAYDRDRVHDSDIKKLIQWYNILVKNGITDFEAVLAPTEGDNVDDRQEAE